MTDFDRPQQADFAAAEMKLYLVRAAQPAGLEAEAQSQGQAIQVRARLADLAMPWPLDVTIARPDGTELFNVHRATDARGVYEESFPLGGNAPRGTYTLRITSPVAGLRATSDFEVSRGPTSPPPGRSPGRSASSTPTRSGRSWPASPSWSSPSRGDRYRKQADELATALRARGLAVDVADERSVFRRHPYPAGLRPVSQGLPADGARATARRDEGRSIGEAPDRGRRPHPRDRRGRLRPGRILRDRPRVLATVAGKGFIDYNAADAEEMYEPGCKIYIDADKKWTVVLGEKTEVQATPEARARWSRPWTRLGTFVGAYNLNPQLPEGYACDRHLILLGDSTAGELIAALQASELLPQVADARYPGPGKALLSFAWSPFALEKDVILVGAPDDAGVRPALKPCWA